MAREWRYAGDFFDCEQCGNGFVEVYADNRVPREFLCDGDSVRCTECGAKGCISADDDGCSVIWAKAKGAGHE